MNMKGYEEFLLLRRSVETMITEHEQLRELTEALRTELAEARRQLAEKNEELKELQTRYERAKFSGALLGNVDDVGMAKKRVNELVREIDKCIALLDR